MRSPIRKFVFRMGYLQNILRLPGGGHLGGIITLYVVRKSEVVSMTAPVNDIVYGAIELLPGSSFSKWICTSQTIGLSSDARPSREGSPKSISLDFFIPLDREEYRTMLARAEEDEFIVVYQYANGKKKVFGAPWAPVLFQFSHDSGKAHQDGNGNNCSFYFDGPGNNYFYEAAIAAPAGPAPALVRFNGAVIASLAPGEIIDITSDYSFNNYFTTA